MKKLIILLFLVLQIACIAQSNVITELWTPSKSVPIITITYPHQHLYYDNLKGSWDMVLTFIPINSTEVNYLLYYFKTGTIATIKMRTLGRILSTTGTVDFIKQSGVNYSITIKNVQMLKPY